MVGPPRYRLLRRQLIGVVGSLLVTGCTGQQPEILTDDSSPASTDTDDDGVSDSVDDFPNNETYTYLVESDTESVRLKPGELKLYRFQVEGVSDLIYRIRTQDNSRIDVFVTDKENFQQYEDRSKWSYYENGSELNTTNASATFTVGTDRTYYLVIDNSAEGAATPATSTAGDTTTTVRIEVELRRRS